MQSSEDQTTSFKEKLLNNTSLLTKRLNSNQKLKNSQASSAWNLKSSSVKDKKPKEIVFVEDSQEEEGQEPEGQESLNAVHEYIEEYQESDEFKNQLDIISSKIMEEGRKFNKENKATKRQLQTKRLNPQKQKSRKKKHLIEQIQGSKEFTSNAKIPEKKQRMKRNIEIKNQVSVSSLNNNISVAKKSSKSKKKKKKSTHEAAKRKEEHRPQQITKPIFLKTGNTIQTPPQDLDSETHCELKERYKKKKDRIRKLGPQKLKERFQQKELIDLQHDEQFYHGQPKNIKKGIKKQEDVKQCFFKIEIKDGYPVARPLSESERKKKLVSRHSQTTIALPDILLAQKPKFKEVDFSIKVQLENFETKEGKKKDKKKSGKSIKPKKPKQKNFQTQFYEQTPEQVEEEEEKDPDVMIAESRPEQVQQEKQQDEQEEEEAEVEVEEKEDVGEVEERQEEEQVEKINLGSKSLLEIVEFLREEGLIKNNQLLQKFRNNYTLKNTMEFLLKFTSGQLKSFNFKNSPFTLADHRRIAELLTSLFSHKYQIGQIISSNKDIQTFLSSLYALKAKKYFELYKTIENESKITWWNEIMKKNEEAIKRSLSKNSMKSESANQNKMKMSQVSTKMKGSQPAPILRSSTVSKKKADFSRSIVQQVII